MNSCSLTLFGVQPLRFGGFEHDMALTAAMASQVAPAPGETPAWATELERLYPGQSFVYRRLAGTAQVTHDGRDMTLSAWLCSNTVLNQHVALLELHATDIDATTMDAGNLRALLVATAQNDRRPAAVKAAMQQARATAARLAGCRQDDVVVPDDTCNVTLFLEPRAGADHPTDTDLQGFLHDAAERLTVNRTLIQVSDRTRVFFGARMHMVVSSSPNDIMVIRQIMFMLQVMWFYVPLYLRHASRLHRDILGKQGRRGLGELEEAAGRLVGVYQTVRLQNESAKISYEALCSLIYEPAERLWLVERTVDQLQRYADFFQSFIRNVREVQSRKADEILNYVLAALGLFGFVGLWANLLTAAAGARDMASFHTLLQIAFTTPLGRTTTAFVAISVVMTFWLVAYGIRARHGGRRKP